MSVHDGGEESTSSPNSRHSIGSTTSSVSLETLERSEYAPLSRRSSHRSRRSTISSIAAFQYEADLLPLSTSEPGQQSVPESEKTVGYLSGVALIISLQIGSGIFSSPGVVLADVKSVGASILVWIIGGLLAWTGASSYAELGSMIPLSGGAQAYLNYSYGPLVSYLFSWTSITLVRPSSGAMICLIFGEYLCRLMFHATGSDTRPDAIPDWAIKVTAAVSVVVITGICAMSARTGTRAAVFFMVSKLVALAAITLTGLIYFVRGHRSTALTEPIFAGTSSNPSSFALALYSSLWAFDGWDQVNFVAGEMTDVGRDLPRAIHTSMALVICLFVATNLAYFVLLDKMTVMLSNTVAIDFGRAVFGTVGATVLAANVAFSCFGAVNSSTFTSARLIYTASRDGYLPAIFGRLHSTRKTPLNAIALHSTLIISFIAFGGGFRDIINFYSVAVWGFYLLTVVGLVVLRVKEPNLERPYKVWITTPLGFSAVALFLLCMPVFAAPLQALAALAFILAGIPVYYITQRRATPHLGAVPRRSRTNEPLSGISGFFSRVLDRVRGRRHTRFSSLEREEETVEILEATDH
ncbi:L-methionine transporter [Cantharellus anzutake]|uniref:L-methionine transporter n=1 Tax=Cantharellus anzutake TaxID=1750568 RepID=UPI0019082F5E|nr:L-methionine transporter [Cantharellus anzutake]KAF8334270.1 L-methionine transporter [Cantharellus anzutake]